MSLSTAFAMLPSPSKAALVLGFAFVAAVPVAQGLDNGLELTPAMVCTSNHYSSTVELCVYI